MKREEGGRPWRTGDAMERVEDGQPRSGVVEMPAGGRPNAVENADCAANRAALR